jgi:hypothetical protein
MINIPKCPKCGSDTAPDLIEINILEDVGFNTYEELYECKCGCRFVALVPRYLDDKVMVHRVEHEEKKFCLSTQY